MGLSFLLFLNFLFVKVMFESKFSALFLIIICFIKTDLKADDELIFKPLSANIYESRLGSVFTDNNDKLRLDIGGNYDFFSQKSDSNFQWALGAEFFTFTRLRSEGSFKFPVETTDFFFGINGSFRTAIEDFPLEGRFRIAHISTHLSDGYSNKGIFFKEPFVYSKEFFDFVISTNQWGFRPYIGGIFIFSYIPKDINLIVPQIGLEYFYQIFNNIEFKFAYDLKIDGYNNSDLDKVTYKAMNMIVAGIIYRTEKNRGIFFKIERYFGKNYYGQFYKDCDNYLGLGFELIYY